MGLLEGKRQNPRDEADPVVGELFEDLEGGARVMDTMLAWFLDVTKSRLAHVVLCITDAQVLGNMHVFKEKSLSARSRFYCLGDVGRGGGVAQQNIAVRRSHRSHAPGIHRVCP